MSDLRQTMGAGLGRLLPRRIPLLYLILSVLVALSVVPLLLYGYWVSSRNREAMQTTEQVLQTTVTRGIAQQIQLYLRSISAQTENLVRFLGSTGAIQNVASPQYAEALDRAIRGYVGAGDEVLYLTILNADQQGRGVGVTEVRQDDFVKQRLDNAFQQAQLGLNFNSGAFLVNRGGEEVPVMVMAQPFVVGNDFRGMVAMVVSLEFLSRRLKDSSMGGLTTYVVDRSGRLIAHSNPDKHTVGQDTSSVEIVQNFLGSGQEATLTTPFMLHENDQAVEMLGTYSPVPELDWAVIAQKPLSAAYFEVHRMELYAFWLALATIVVSVGIGVFSAWRLTTPLQVLAETTKAIAKGDFSRRVNLPSRTEIGELASTFNLMSEDLEKYVEQLKQAAQENHELFLGSIRTLAAAIDEKDPYTRGHSGRVSKYSVLLAECMGLADEEVSKIRISALLHDVGKIGVDDRVLKKPSGLTPEEFELMKQHPVKGANIIRPVAKLREMIPGIELHHEGLDGHGYPYGLKGEEIPMMARIIAVADTLDAMTTNRPYQVAMDLGAALERIRSLQVKKFDPVVVDALFSAVETGRLKLTPAMVEV
ncbi:MAG: HD domain-containing phosphohydrolase [Candidatus Acidiferrales bacterium]